MGIITCGTTISSTGDGCYQAGELESGFNITASNSTDLVAISENQIGNMSPLVGAGTFAEFTIITFTNPVYAVAFDVWENIDPVTEITIYDPSGVLINSYNANTPINTQTFFGFISDEAFGRVEVEGNNESGELVGNMYFGADCQTFYVNEVQSSKISFYPNPSSDFIQFENLNGILINSVEAIDLLGKQIPLVLNSDNTVDISGLSKGTYILNLITSEGKLTQKLIKN